MRPLLLALRLLQPETASFEAETDLTSLCEPYDARWRVTFSERDTTRDLIELTARRLGADPAFFLVVADRESSFRESVRHRMEADVDLAMLSYLMSADQYGWGVRWPLRDRKAKKLHTLQLEPLASRGQNPYYEQTERWTRGGLGPHGLNPGYHVAKWDPMAPPEILCDAVVSTIVVHRIARRAVEWYGARSWTEVNAVLGGRVEAYWTPSGRRRSRAKRDLIMDRKFCERAKRWKVHCEKPPKLGKKLGFGPSDEQESFADAVRGRSLGTPDPVG